jgi:hypothetical protein
VSTNGGAAGSRIRIDRRRLARAGLGERGAARCPFGCAFAIAAASAQHGSRSDPDGSTSIRRSALDQSLIARRPALAFGEVRADAAPQIGRFADVEDFAAAS